ncbi:redoxin domain-containing protein [Taibaiella lutea]|uniref:Redoxin domain-containing protein n=1 Tax=Taibaiella lutea TaxID=2608001 RepID=A0A5M6CIR2_9BACT|nr:redoxin domain-containing protein [Taibaiella lutea]KAA5534907.1 redoxin domain-containing protein [Taibaiella lutea]
MKYLSIRVLFALLMLLPYTSRSQQKALPDFHFLNTDKEAVGKKDIPKGKALLLIYFRSDCDHCEHTAMQLKTTAAKYPAIIWMVSAEEIPALRTFEDMAGLYDVNNLTVVQDNNHQMHKAYDFTQLPFIVLYSSSGKQLRTFSELPSVETVRKILNGK